MDNIIESIVNGGRKQALQQLRDSEYTFEDLIVELETQSMNDEILRMLRIAINTSYLVEA